MRLKFMISEDLQRSEQEVSRQVSQVLEDLNPKKMALEDKMLLLRQLAEHINECVHPATPTNSTLTHLFT